MSEAITTITSLPGTTTAKTWVSLEEKPSHAQPALQFFVEEHPVSNIFELAELVRELEPKDRTCIVRGKFVGPEKAKEMMPEIKASNPGKYDNLRPGYFPRKDELFPDQPSRYFMLDVDGFRPEGIDPVLDPEAAINQYIAAKLPDAFQLITFCWQLSGSAGHPTAKGVLKAHVWFWLSTPRTCRELMSWKQGFDIDIDESVFKQGQQNFTAAPVFKNGIKDPVPRRSGLCEGMLGDEVDLVIPEHILARVRTERKKREDLVDPSEKDNLIGILCRTFEIEEVVERWLSDVFEFCDGSDTRMNFLQSSSGAEGGAFVSDDRQGIANTHNSDPFGGRKANKWDLIRHYKFGHLDADLAPHERELFGIAGLPSQRAMKEFVLSLPEIKAQMHEEKTSGCQALIDAIGATGNETELQSLIETSIASDRGLSVVDRAKLETVLKNKFASFGVRLQMDVIRRMMRPRRVVRPFPDLAEDGVRPLETLDNLSVLCENEQITLRYNMIKKDVEVMVPGASWSIDNRKTSGITMLRSRCHKAGMSVPHLPGFVITLADQNQYNPVADWITSKPWDGVSRLQDWYDTVKEHPEETSKRMKETLMRRWAISAIAAAFSPNGIMARGVLVFTGAQYKGKTRWFERLAPKEFNVIKTGHNLTTSDKDSVKQAVSSWITELGELDATFRKSDIAALKAFISKDQDEIRLPYAPAESTFPRRTAFCGSVNEKDFLQDPTGNSRFWTISIESVDHEHRIDVQQFWAEVLVLWQGGEQHFLTEEEMAELNNHNTEFEAANPIMEMIHTNLDWGSFDPKDCRWMSATDVLAWIGVKKVTKGETIDAGRAITKLNGGLRKKSNGQRYLAVPKRRRYINPDVVEVEFEEEGADIFA